MQEATPEKYCSFGDFWSAFQPLISKRKRLARAKAVLGAGIRLSDCISASLLARAISAEDVHAVLDAHGCNSQRMRSFPAVAGVYYCMALSLYPEAAYEEVFAVVAQGLARAAGQPQPDRVAKSSISALRFRIGP